ncbi:ThuA domain-containing protein [Peterkaempfera sp. SMS 1(5)a]|uniref:ThuA domain-containing protein n=1 Tax=Peterkaempfera podocarpi TaxID=3232308 RepID=UPI00366DF13C
MLRTRIAAAAMALATVLPLGAAAHAQTGTAADGSFRVLVFSRTTGFRHDSIPAGVAAIQKLGQEHHFAVDATEDATVFTDAGLAKYRAVVFLSSTGDPVDQPEEKAAFQRYIEHGGGYVGVHAAADSGYEWAWYGGLVGAYFKNHPAQQNATVDIAGPRTVSTRGLPDKWTRFDEWYNYRTNPRDAGVRVLATLDESTYDDGADVMGDHPITWCQRYDGGRAWYTGMGHTIESYSDPLFLGQLLGGIRMAAGTAAFPCGPNHRAAG